MDVYGIATEMGESLSKSEIDDMLEHIPMSQVFGGSKVKK